MQLNQLLVAVLTYLLKSATEESNFRKAYRRRRQKSREQNFATESGQVYAMARLPMSGPQRDWVEVERGQLQPN